MLLISAGCQETQPRSLLSLWILLNLWFLEHSSSVPTRTSSKYFSTFWNDKGGMFSHMLPPGWWFASHLEKHTLRSVSSSPINAGMWE